MAYFAKIGEGNKVTAVHTIHNNELLDENGQESEQKGIDFLNKLYHINATWVQTSFNTARGKHSSGKTPLRKNYAGVGFTYDANKDAFIPPSPFPSWILNEETCQWDAPRPRPDSLKNYRWDELTKNWIRILEPK